MIFSLGVSIVPILWSSVLRHVIAISKLDLQLNPPGRSSSLSILNSSTSSKGSTERAMKGHLLLFLLMQICCADLKVSEMGVVVVLR